MANPNEWKRPDGIRLIGERVILRPWQFTDKPSLIENADNDKVAIHLRDQFPCPYTNEDADRWLHFTTTVNDEEEIYLAIEVEGKAVGGVSIRFGVDVHRCSAELGYWLGETFWGRGMVSEAVKLITGHVFDKYAHIERVFAAPFSTNMASSKVLQKNHFQFEGTLRKAAIRRDGLVVDQLVYASFRE